MNHKQKLYDLIGIGFGPSNLALCVALKEYKANGLYLFLERRSEFKWHPDMLLEESTMQTPFLKDLITTVNPQSRFTFLSYLREKGRLNEFINLHEFFPSRPEFNDYYAWAANYVKHNVRYNYEVVNVSPVLKYNSSHISALNITIRDLNTHAKETLYAANVALGMGAMPSIPCSCAIESCRIFHSEDFLKKLKENYLNKAAPYSFLVIGAGQSAAEISHYLLKNYPNAQIAILSRGLIFKSIDDNPFVNAYYSGDKVRTIYNLNQNGKKLLFQNLKNSNYAVVDGKTIHMIARIIYEEKVIKKSRLTLHPFSDIIELKENQSTVNVVAKDLLKEHITTMYVDGICLATGYNNNRIFNLLKNIDPYLIRDADDSYCTDVDYKLKTVRGFLPKIYVQGYAEKSHGFTEGTVAGLADRAQFILTSLKSH